MTDQIEFIAVANKDQGGTTADLNALALRVAGVSDAEIKDHKPFLVTFMATPDAAVSLVSEFGDKLLFDENQPLQRIVPTPGFAGHSNAAPLSPTQPDEPSSNSGNDDDGEIREF